MAGTYNRAVAPTAGTRSRLLGALLCFLCAVSIGACTATGHEAARSRPGGEPEKPWSGLSYAAATRVEQLPSRAAGSGFDAERVWSGEDDWEPFVAVDPGGHYVYQVTTRWLRPKYRIVIRRSLDGGATWEADRLLYDSGIGQADPSARVAADGTVFVVWLEKWSTVLSRSEDHGVTWSTPIVLNAGLPWSDYPSIAVSPDSRDVYVAFNKSSSFVVASHDGGRTFSPPVKTNRDRRYWFDGGGSVAPNGDVYFGATSMRPTFRGRVRIVALRSRDGGDSWEEIDLDASAETPACEWAAGCYQGFLGPVAGIAADPAGDLLAVYNAGDADGAPQQIWSRSSADGGESWTPRQRLSRPSPLVHNAFARVAAGPAAGDFRVVWQGDRGRLTDAWNTFYRQSLDGGASWGPRRRLSDQPAGAPYKKRRGYAFPYGDYLGLAVDRDGRSFVIWGEGASYLGPGGSWYTRGN
jgi:BNR repeat-like domain